MWEKIRSKIGQWLLYFLSGSFIKPVMLSKYHDYIIVVDGKLRDEDIDSLQSALETVINGEILVISGMELNIIGLADENQNKQQKT